jgi:hypothetical protein
MPLHSTGKWQLHQGSDMARGDDNAKLKSAIVEWVNNSYQTGL